MVLGLVLGKTMDSNFRKAAKLALIKKNPLAYIFSRPVTIVLTVCIVLVILSNISFVKKHLSLSALKARFGKKAA